MNRRYILKSIVSSATVSFSLYSLGKNRNDTTNLQRAIEKSVYQSNIPDRYEPWFGDCWHIAVALRDLYETDIYGLKHKQNPEYPFHVFVKADGKFFDGKGDMTVSDLKKEWPRLIPEINKYPKKYITDVPYYRKSKKENIENLISETYAYKKWTP